MIEVLPGDVTHTDVVMEYEQRLKDGGLSSDEIAHKVKLNRVAYANIALDVYHPLLSGERKEQSGLQLVNAVENEASRRGAHYHRYRMMTHAGVTGMLLDGTKSPLSLPEQSLLELKSRIDALPQDAYDLAKNLYGGKGISAELGHVDQLGDWDAVRPLDADMRGVLVSPVLRNAGFVFNNNFIRKDQAKIDYGFNVGGRLESPVTIAKRKRAAADVYAGDDAAADKGSYELIKQSTFLIKDDELSDRAKRLVGKVKDLASIKKPTTQEKQRLDGVMQEAGMTIVEPLIGDRNKREKQVGVIAATSVYFALNRYR